MSVEREFKRMRGKLTHFSPATGSAVPLPHLPAAGVTQDNPETQKDDRSFKVVPRSLPSCLWISICVKLCLALTHRFYTSRMWRGTIVSEEQEVSVHILHFPGLRLTQKWVHWTSSTILFYYRFLLENCSHILIHYFFHTVHCCSTSIHSPSDLSV